MEELKKSKKASAEQKEYLLNYMEENLKFAQDIFESPDGAHLKFAKWKTLAANLNAIGGASKDVNQWRKFWRDQKLHIKEKEALLKAALQSSGINWTKRLKSLTPFEERVLEVLAPASISGPDVCESFSSSQAIKSETTTDLAQLLEDEDNMAIDMLDEEEENLIGDTQASTSQVTPMIYRTASATRKRKKATSGKAIEINSFEDKILKIEEEKLNYIKKSYELQEKAFMWKQTYQAEILEIKKKEIQLKEKELLLKKL